MMHVQAPNNGNICVRLHSSLEREGDTGQIGP